MKDIFIAVLVVVAVAISSVDVFSDSANTVSGKIIMLRIEGVGNFYYLKDNKGREIFLDGVGDPSKQWMSKAEESGQTVILRGNIVKDGDGFSFENGSYELVSSNPTTAENNSLATEKVGIYGFYLGQSVQEVLNNAAEKNFNINYDFQSGEEQILNDLRKLPNGQNISDIPGTNLSLLPNVLSVIYGNEYYSQLKNKFNDSINILGKEGSENLKHYFFELSVYRNDKIPKIYLGFVLDKEKGTKQLYQIKIYSITGDYYDNYKDFFNKLESTIISRYGELSKTSSDNVRFKDIDGKLIISTNFYQDVIDKEFAFYFYDNKLINNIVKGYIDSATRINNDAINKALDDM